MSDYVKLSTDDLQQDDDAKWMPAVLRVSIILAVIAISLSLIGFVQA